MDLRAGVHRRTRHARRGRPGRWIYRYADVSGAAFSSYLWWSQTWHDLSQPERDEVKQSIKINRVGASEPGYAGGYHTADRTYSSQGTGFNRRTYRPL